MMLKILKMNKFAFNLSLRKFSPLLVAGVGSLVIYSISSSKSVLVFSAIGVPEQTSGVIKARITMVTSGVFRNCIYLT